MTSYDQVNDDIVRPDTTILPGDLQVFDSGIGAFESTMGFESPTGPIKNLRLWVLARSSDGVSGFTGKLLTVNGSKQTSVVSIPVSDEFTWYYFNTTDTNPDGWASVFSISMEPQSTPEFGETVEVAAMYIEAMPARMYHEFLYPAEGNFVLGNQASYQAVNERIVEPDTNGDEDEQIFDATDTSVSVAIGFQLPKGPVTKTLFWFLVRKVGSGASTIDNINVRVGTSEALGLNVFWGITESLQWFSHEYAAAISPVNSLRCDIGSVTIDGGTTINIEAMYAETNPDL